MEPKDIEEAFDKLVKACELMNDPPDELDIDYEARNALISWGDPGVLIRIDFEDDSVTCALVSPLLKTDEQFAHKVIMCGDRIAQYAMLQAISMLGNDLLEGFKSQEHAEDSQIMEWASRYLVGIAFGGIVADMRSAAPRVGFGVREYE